MGDDHVGIVVLFSFFAFLYNIINYFYNVKTYQHVYLKRLLEMGSRSNFPVDNRKYSHDSIAVCVFSRLVNRI